MQMSIVVLFLLFGGVTKVMKVGPVLEANVRLGYPESLIGMTGAHLIALTVLYAVPRTSILGAMLLTGYLGGAVAIQLRAGSPLFSETLFPIYFGVFAWGGLYLRDERLRALI
jgi:DoxX-like family